MERIRRLQRWRQTSTSCHERKAVAQWATRFHCVCVKVQIFGPSGVCVCSACHRLVIIIIDDRQHRTISLWVVLPPRWVVVVVVVVAGWLAAPTPQPRPQTSQVAVVFRASQRATSAARVDSVRASHTDRYHRTGRSFCRHLHADGPNLTPFPRSDQSRAAATNLASSKEVPPTRAVQQERKKQP